MHSHICLCIHTYIKAAQSAAAPVRVRMWSIDDLESACVCYKCERVCVCVCVRTGGRHTAFLFSRSPGVFRRRAIFHPGGAAAPAYIDPPPPALYVLWSRWPYELLRRNRYVYPERERNLRTGIWLNFLLCDSGHRAWNYLIFNFLSIARIIKG